MQEETPGSSDGYREKKAAAYISERRNEEGDFIVLLQGRASDADG